MTEKLNKESSSEIVQELFIQGLEIFNFGILVPGDLNFLCVAYLLGMCSILAAGGQMAGSERA